MGEEIQLVDRSRRFVSYPPAVVSVVNLGYLEDTNGRWYSRDIGRSSVFGGRVIMQFGDTFAHNQEGKFVGLTSCTAAVVHDPGRPTLSSYSNLKIDGGINSFIPLWERETDGSSSESEEDEREVRSTLWTFGGIIQDGAAPQRHLVAGWTFFQKGTMREGDLIPTLEHTGASKVFCNTDKPSVSALRAAGTSILFANNEPSFGTFTAIVREEFAYLFGHAASSTDVMLARVPARWVCLRHLYEYWDGFKYQKELAKAKPVMTEMQHGSIFRSNLFKPKTGHDWVFVGEASSADNKVTMGVSKRLEGPYRMTTLMDTYPLRHLPGADYQYCVYAHPWAFDETAGELMVTWCEGTMHGKIVAVKIKLATGPPVKKATNSPEGSLKRGKESKRGCCVIL